MGKGRQKGPLGGHYPKNAYEPKGNKEKENEEGEASFHSFSLLLTFSTKATTVESRISEPFGSSTETSPNRVSSLCLQQFYKAHKCQQQQFLH